MSRSYRKVNKSPVCCVGHKGIHDWKKFSRKHRRAKEKFQMNGIYEDDEGFDEDTCYEIKYQKDRSTNDWTGPHDGWNIVGYKTFMKQKARGEWLGKYGRKGGEHYMFDK